MKKMAQTRLPTRECTPDSAIVTSVDVLAFGMHKELINSTHNTCIQ